MLSVDSLFSVIFYLALFVEILQTLAGVQKNIFEKHENLKFEFIPGYRVQEGKSSHLWRIVGFLCEDPEYELALLIRVEGGGHDDVGPGG